MKTNLLLATFLLVAAAVFAEPHSVSGSAKGPVVVLVTGLEGAVNLWHGEDLLKGWIFPGPYTAAVILAGPLDKVEWDGSEGVLVPAGANATERAQKALAKDKAPRLVLVNADGASQVIEAPDDEQEMDYDAASAATAEE